ncbi:MAG TPA: hypothetical protein VFC51_11855 [Chloroflexota bacterium]|nr:hypothetical protein [Chloroflexota bacterium]
MTWQTSLTLGLIFSTIAGSMAFLITYDEYSRHQMLSRGDVMKHSVQAAAVAMFFFIGLSLVAGAWLGSIVQSAGPLPTGNVK